MLLNHKGNRYLIKDCTGLRSIKGLMFDSMKNTDGAMIYGSSIWMPFVRQPLQLIFLDRNDAVLKVMNAIPMTYHPKTWKFYTCIHASRCIEMKNEIDVCIGEKLNFVRY